MLARIIEEAEPLGRDFDLVRETLDAVASLADDRSVRSVSNVARQRKWYLPGRSRRMRERALATLAKIGSPAALSAIETLEKTGDRQLRKLARAARPNARTAA